MENNSPEVKEANKLVESFNEATNGPRFGIFEQVLCSQIYQAANNADPLRQIQLITQAALMLDTDKKKALNIETEKLEVIRATMEAFITGTDITTEKKLYKISFGFESTEENYGKYISPWWIKKGLTYYPLSLADDYEHLGTCFKEYYCTNCGNYLGSDKGDTPGFKSGHCNYCGAKLEQDIFNLSCLRITHTFEFHDSVPYPLRFFALTQVLASAGYVTLKNSFVHWAMPIAMDILRKLTLSVRPEIYNEIAKMFSEFSKEGGNHV